MRDGAILPQVWTAGQARRSTMRARPGRLCAAAPS